MHTPELVHSRGWASGTSDAAASSPFAGDAGVLEGKTREASDAKAYVVRLFDELRVSVFRYLRWLGATPEEADDAIQETFLRLHTHLLSGGSRENLRAWIFRVAGNVIRDQRRAARRQRNEPLEDKVHRGDSWRDPGISPEQRVLADESTARLGAAIRRLPADQQKCLALRNEGFRYREIAELLGIGVTTVADALRRAIQTLARELP